MKEEKNQHYTKEKANVGRKRKKEITRKMTRGAIVVGKIPHIIAIFLFADVIRNIS